MAQEIKMSAAGLKAMQEELEYLKTVRRKELAEEIKVSTQPRRPFREQRVRRGQEYAGSGGEPHHRTGADDQERRHH